MNIEIVATNDDSFRISQTELGEKTIITPKIDKIKTKQMGDLIVATDGKCSVIGKTEEDAIQGIKDAQIAQIPQTNAAPLENSREGHPFDFFGGTSWVGKRQGFN